MRALGTVGIGGALASGLGASLSGSPLLALLVVLAAGLAAGLVELRGPSAALCFKLLYVVLIAACLPPAEGLPIGTYAWTSSVDYLLGGVFACLTCLLLIPSQRDTRPRTEVVAVYDALLRFADFLATTSPAHDSTPHKQEIRLRIEAARAAVTARRGLRDPLGLLHYAYAVAVADAIFALLIVAGELRERAGDTHGLPLAYAARCLADTQEQVRQALARHAPDLPALSAMLTRDLRSLVAQRPNASAPPPYQSALAALAQHPGFDRWRERFVWPNTGVTAVLDRLAHTLADLAARDARVSRHAVRLALAGGLSLLPSQIWQVHHSYWVAVTVIMVLSPRLQTTRQISFLRFAGSLGGALLACVISLMHPTPALALGISAAFLAAAYATRLAGNAGAFAFCLTPAVILFSWLGEPAASSSHVAALRGADTAIGCLIALASYVVLAPRAELSRALSAAPARLEALRVAAGRASTRAEDTLAQCAAELDPALAATHRALHATARRHRIGGDLHAARAGRAGAAGRPRGAAGRGGRPAGSHRRDGRGCAGPAGTADARRSALRPLPGRTGRLRGQPYRCRASHGGPTARLGGRTGAGNALALARGQGGMR